MQVHDNQQIAIESRYPSVYKKQGIRYLQQIAKPPIINITELEPIHLSVLHYYTPGDNEQFGIPENHPLLSSTMRQASYHISDYLVNVMGPTKKRIFNTKLAIKSYHSNNKSIFWLRDENKLKGMMRKYPWNIIYDYSLMSTKTIYRHHIDSFKYKFLANHGTYLKGIESALRTMGNERHHLVMIHLPDVLPSIVDFKRAAKELKRPLYKIFPGHKELVLLDLWRWMDGEFRNKSMMGITLKDMRKHKLIDLVIRYKNKMVLLNLAKLDSFLSGSEQTQVEDEEEASLSTSFIVMKRVHQMFQTMIDDGKLETTDAIEEIENKANQEVLKIYDTSTDETLKDSDFSEDEPVDAVPDVGSDAQGVDEPLNKQVTEKDEPLEMTGANVQPLDLYEDNPMSSSKPAPASTSGASNLAAGEKGRQRNLLDSILSHIHGNVEKESAELGMTEREAEYWEKQSLKFKKMKSPLSKDETIEEYITKPVDLSISKESTSIPDIPLVIDKSMLNSAVTEYDKKYITKALDRDIVRNFVSIQNTGVAITGYEVDRAKSTVSDFDIHRIQFTPVGGTPTTISIPIPHVDEDGVIRSGSTCYRLRKLRVDRFLRKVAENKVAMTSYYGKLFFDRCERRKFDQTGYIGRVTNELISNKIYEKIKYGKVILKDKHIPPLIVSLANKLQSFTFVRPGGKVKVDLTNITLKDGSYILGEGLTYNLKKKAYFLKGKEVSSLDAFGIDEYQLPDTFAEVKILGQMIPVGWILARQLGFRKFIDKFKIPHEKLERNGRYEDKDKFIELKFSDEKWIFDKRILSDRDRLLIAGFLNYASDIKHYSVYDFDNADVYGAIMADNGIAVRYERELDLIFDMFIDPTTREKLIKDGDTTDLALQFARAAELLTTSHAVKEINMEDMEIKGYERVAGAVYRTLVTNLRVFKSKAITHKRRFDMKPNDVWLMLAKDPAMEIVDEINPIQNCKEKENVTFLGEGGRSRRSMVRNTRAYDPTDMGTISESTVDSMDVGVTTFLSANPKLTTLRGDTDRFDPNKDGASSIYSTTALTSPFIEHDDSKRQLFASVQASHRIPIKGAMPSPIRTGYENILAHRSDTTFSYPAKQDGVIKEVSKKYFIVKYKDNTEETIEIGLRIANSKGATYQHELVCDRPVGYKFKKGEILMFNRMFYTRDILNPTQVVMNDKILATTILIETNETFEDSSALSSAISYGMESTAVKQKTIVIDAANDIQNVIGLNENVEADSALMFINDATFKGAEDKFGKTSVDVLMKLARVAPKAGVKGKVIKREMFYFCEEEELSDTLKDLTTEINKQTFGGTKVKMKERRVLSGQINEPLKFGSDYIGPGQVAIRYYIASGADMGVGDKCVFANQLKSVVSRVYGASDYRSQSGVNIDAMFSYSSISNRIVASAELIGTLNRLLIKVTEKAIEAYDS